MPGDVAERPEDDAGEEGEADGGEGKGSTLLFSYASNMCRERLRDRVPSARIRGRAVLAGHELRFHKESDVDGSGKADVHHTGRPKDRVWGVLARISARDRTRMDEYEGVGSGYFVDHLPVRTGDGRVVEAAAYRAQASAVRPGLRPFSWYLRLVVTGALQHGLPASYVRRLRALPADPDPDAERARRNLSVLE